nr:cytochrome P450 [Tanacetum cinerariifolium]
MYNDGVFQFGKCNEVSDSDRCNVNMEQVKEIGELIGLSEISRGGKAGKVISRDSNGGRKFTRVSDDGVKFSKLDRFLLNEEFNELWGNLSVIPLDRKLSDHFLIVLKDTELDFSPKPFRVFYTWLEEHDFLSIVEGTWKKNVRSIRPDCIFWDRLKNVEASHRVWSKDRFGGHKECIENLKKEALTWELKAEQRGLNDIERGIWIETRKRWMEKEKEYGNMLCQKARIKWDVEGDENSNVETRKGGGGLNGLQEEHPRCCQAMDSKVEERLVHLIMVVKFEVLIKKKKMCSLVLVRFDWLMEFLMVHLEELEMKKLL